MQQGDRGGAEPPDGDGPRGLDLPGPARRIRIEPVKLPDPSPAPSPEPAPAPEAPPERAPEPAREPEPAPASGPGDRSVG